MKCRKNLNQSGFTLIEIIATVVIVAIFSAVMLTFFSDSLIKSSDPFRRLRKSSDLSKVMANMMADYNPYARYKRSTSYDVGNKVLPSGNNGRFYICTATTGDKKSGETEPQWHDYGPTQDGKVTWKAGVWVEQTPYSVGDLVIPTNPNGHFYRCTTAGSSGTTEPTWLLIGGAAISDGAVQWSRLLQYLKDQIGAPDPNNKKNNSYGQYYVLENRFVKFVSNSITPISGADPENILQVTIKNDEGETLTALFTAKEES